LNYLGANNVDVLNIERREQASDPEILEKLKTSDVVMFTGGDQLRLTSILGGTPFHEILLDKYKTKILFMQELLQVLRQLLII